MKDSRKGRCRLYSGFPDFLRYFQKNASDFRLTNLSRYAHIFTITKLKESVGFRLRCVYKVCLINLGVVSPADALAMLV